MVDFEGKSAVVTGGMNGIGLATVQELLAENIKNIAILDITTDDAKVNELKSKFPTSAILFIQTDVSCKKQVAEAYTRIDSEFGHINFVVNAAGIFNEHEIDQTLGVNIGGVVHSSLCALTYMSREKSGDGGSIVNISSIAGLTNVFYSPVYASSKHAVLAFTNSMAHEIHLMQTGVKFMTICPGATQTHIIDPDLGISSRLLFPYTHEFADLISKDVYYQPPKNVGSCVVQAIKTDKNGSIWISNNNINKEVNIPQNPFMEELLAEFK